MALALWNDAEDPASNVIAYPETRAALGAARRGRRISPSQHEAAIARLEYVGEQLLMPGVDEQLARRAGDLAEEHGLRGYDAVHLATALALGEEVTVVTWDGDLAAAAEGSGCPTAGLSAP